MATLFPPDAPAPVEEDLVEKQINETINRFIDALNHRRIYLVGKYRLEREEMRANKAVHAQMEQEVTELDAKIAELRINAPPPQELRFVCDTQILDEHISHLGDIEQFEIPTLIPNYAAFEVPIVAFGIDSTNDLDFEWPRGVAVHEKTGHIYVADYFNQRVHKFSDIGKFIGCFGYGDEMTSLWGLLIDEDNLYVSDWAEGAIFMIALTDLKLIKRVGKEGQGREEFDSPNSMALSPSKLLYVADEFNNRIQILTRNLLFKGSLKHQSMTRPVDVKFSSNRMLVLSCADSPCVHIFTHSGEKINSMITRGYKMEVLSTPYFFCLDARDNIIVSDWGASDLKVFSQDGDLLHTLGRPGNAPGTFLKPHGIALYQNTKLITVSCGQTVFQIFSA